ncbi:MAG TPA: TonB-dependent receptor [Rhizomicrobium sp.]|nr:TonB-dependent receptor [Rhizomicrobium sp.]
MRRTLSLSTSILALVCCSAAQAQTASSGGVETVVVTAERRTENLMKTPITASVLSSEDLQNRDVFNVNALQFVAPNVTINDLGQGIDFDIRGIGKGEHNTQTPVGVVTYHDGASTFPGYMTAEPFYDIKSVEVFRGPQGTFVGQNATGGAVFVTTADPVIGGDYDGYVMSGFGNYDDGMVQGAVNIPLTDTLALRVSAYDEARGSFYTITDSDPADNCPEHKYANCKPGYNPGDLKESAERLSLLWRPMEPLTVSLKYDVLYQDFGAAPAVPFSQLLPVGAPVQPYGFLNPYHDSNLYHATANAPESRLDREQRVILKADYVFANGIKLQSISDYNAGNTSWVTDLDSTDYGNPSDYPYFGTTNDWTFLDKVDENVYSEEINLISPDNQPITWVVGLYGQENDYVWKPPYQFYIAVGPRLGANPVPNINNLYQYTSYTFQGHTSNQDIAAFGQVDAKLGDGIDVSLGGRWTETRSQNNVTIWDYGGTPFGTPYNDLEGQASDNLSYKAAIDWTVNDGDFLYGFVATGYTGGGLNTFTSATAGPAPFNPVTDTNYEVGWKRTSWFDGHMRTTLDAFYTDYDHFQIILSDPNIPLNTYEVNLPKATTIYGVEGDAQGSFGAFSFDATIGYLKSSIADFWAIDPRYNMLANGLGNCNPTSGGTNPYCVNVKGNPITYAPNFTYNLMAQYMFDFGGGQTLTPRVSFAHVAPQWATIFDNSALGDRLGMRNLLGAQIEWKTKDWVWTLYGDNLTNQQYVASNNSGSLYAGLPRQFGVRLMKAF